MGGSSVSPTQSRGNDSSSMSQAWYSSLFGGTPNPSTFPRMDRLHVGNLATGTITSISYLLYVSATAQVSPSFPIGYNPIRIHALRGPFLLGGTYLEGNILSLVILAHISDM